jgi:hypothetical protein
MPELVFGGRPCVICCAPELARLLLSACWRRGLLQRKLRARSLGACAAYGYAYDFPSSQAAQAAAIKKCGPSCKQIVTTSKGCAALAVDGHKPCGPNGYANATQLGVAQNAALKSCYRYGGRDCVIRAWICDGKKG